LPARPKQSEGGEGIKGWVKYQSMLKKILFILFLLTITKSPAQNISDEEENTCFASANLGYQISGIKSEDFVSSNYSPLFNFTVGKWLSSYLALQIGSKGFYFNYIGDNIKHHYNYFYGEALINLHNIVQPKKTNKVWNLLIHAGAGYFYNYDYDKPNFCFNTGLQNNYQLSDQFQANLDISSIIGWDIYQGNLDILPGVTLGFTYSFQW
jgi:hypothetical protein